MARALRPRGGKVRTFLGVILLLIGSGGRSVAAGQESLDIEQIAAERDLYAVLDLQPGAEAFDIKAAYRKLAKKWHPDKNPDDTQTAQAKFAEIAEAYEVLSDETSRQLYDHARRVRAAHDHPNSAGGAGAGAGAGAARDTAPDWYYDGMGWDWDDFGSSFSGGGGAGVGAGAGAGAGFGEAFGSGLFGGGGGGGGARMGGDGGGGGAYIFRTRDPMELFEAFFGGGVFDVDVDGGSPEAEFYYSQDPYEFHQHQYQHQHQQQQQQQRQRQGASWDGQDFEQYQDYEDGGQMYRRVITTKAYLDGTQQSTAQDFLFDKLRDAWFEKTGSFEYHGPGVAPVGECCGGNGRGDHPVDNVLRMGEFLRVGHSISSIDRRFAAVLESDCNLVVYHSRGGGKEVKVWETNSYSSEGVCFAAIQDNGMLVVMAGTDPTAPGNVLWSTNRGRVGWMWVQDTAFHAAVLPSGNLVVSQGESPMHPAARRCVWGAFGCPGDGSVLEWKLVWMSFRSKAGDIWCKVVGCDWADDYSYSGAGSGGFPPRGKSGSDVEGGGGFRGGDLLTQPAAAFKKAAEQGVAWLSDALAKLKAAAEDTAYAASRPRHW